MRWNGKRRTMKGDHELCNNINVVSYTRNCHSFCTHKGDNGSCNRTNATFVVFDVSTTVDHGDDPLKRPPKTIANFRRRFQERRAHSFEKVFTLKENC